MRVTSAILVSILAVAFAISLPSVSQAEILISINKSTQRMTVLVDGALRHVWPVSTGRSGHATPVGSFAPFRMEEDHYSKEWDDAPMPHSIFFTRFGHAIHGSYAVKKLGAPASAGCVRLAPDNAAALFALVKEQGLANVRVVIAGVEPPPGHAPRRAVVAEDAPAVPEVRDIAAADMANVPHAEPAVLASAEGAQRFFVMQVTPDGALGVGRTLIRPYGLKLPDRNRICSFSSGARWACGNRAHGALRSLVMGRAVICSITEPSQSIAVCKVDGVDLSELMLRHGWAELSEGVTDEAYRRAMELAKSRKIGLWADRLMALEGLSAQPPRAR